MTGAGGIVVVGGPGIVGACACWRRAAVAGAGDRARALVRPGPHDAPHRVWRTALAAGGARVFARRLGQRRRAAVPRLLEQVASELRAGGTVRTAAARLATAAGPLRTELARLHARLQLGAPLADALRDWAGEVDAAPAPGAGAAAAAGALAMAATAGGPAADALDALAASLDERAAVAAEARALSAQARASAFVVGVAPVGYLAFALVTGGAAAKAIASSGIGRLSVAAGLLLDLLGALAIRWLLREDALW